MAGFSLTTLFVKLATRTGAFGAFAVLAIAATMVALAAVTDACLGGAFAGKTAADCGVYRIRYNR